MRRVRLGGVMMAMGLLASMGLASAAWEILETIDRSRPRKMALELISSEAIAASLAPSGVGPSPPTPQPLLSPRARRPRPWRTITLARNPYLT